MEQLTEIVLLVPSRRDDAVAFDDDRPPALALSHIKDVAGGKDVPVGTRESTCKFFYLSRDGVVSVVVEVSGDGTYAVLSRLTMFSPITHRGAPPATTQQIEVCAHLCERVT